MNAQMREMVKSQILHTLNQLPDPAERLQLLRDMIPGAVEIKESHEMLVIRIGEKLAQKKRYAIPEKPIKTKKSTLKKP